VASGLLSAGKDSLETNEPRKFPLNQHFTSNCYKMAQTAAKVVNNKNYFSPYKEVY